MEVVRLLYILEKKHYYMIFFGIKQKPTSIEKKNILHLNYSNLWALIFLEGFSPLF